MGTNGMRVYACKELLVRPIHRVYVDGFGWIKEVTNKISGCKI
jgi:hypothetical protein